jgi:hypothetical protein
MKERKRKALLSQREEFKLLHLITARLLPPRPRDVLPCNEWSQWDREEAELSIKVLNCLYEGMEDTESDEEIIEEITERVHDAAQDTLNMEFDVATKGLDPEKRGYIARELRRRFPRHAPSNPERDPPGAIKEIRRIKDFLRRNGLSAGEADELIAKALGKTAGTLLKTLDRAK